MKELIEEMLARDAITPDTIITAWYVNRDNNGRYIKSSDDFKFIKIGENYGSLILLHLLNQKIFKVQSNNIITIDGMTPHRYVEVYGINPDGSYMQSGKKRGRKAKVVS